MSRLDDFKGFIGDLARPFAIWSTAGATAWAIAWGYDADKIGAAGLIVAALYAGKVIEKREEIKQEGAAKIAQAANVSAENIAAGASGVPTASDLPPWERTK